MTGIPQIIPVPSVKANASYDFVDIATGLGFVLYYGVSGAEPTQTYILASEPLRSNLTYTGRSGAGTTTLTFDTSVFNLPRTVKGTALYVGDYFSTTTEAKRLTITIQKIDVDSNVTNLSSAVSSNTGNVVINMTSVLMQLPLTQTTIKKGEKLRLKIDMVVDTGTGAFEIGHDGGNRNGSSINLTTFPDATTVMKLYIPFRVDL